MPKKPWEELPQVWKTESAFWTYCKGVMNGDNKMGDMVEFYG